MESNEVTDPDYIRRFNDGYVLCKYMPELSEQLSHAKSKSPAFLAMQDGRKQYLLEQSREKLPSWINRNSSSERPRSLTRDKGKSIEPER